MGAEPDLESWLAQIDLSLEDWQTAVRKQRVISFPNADGTLSPDLSTALHFMRGELAPPDRLIIRTDGRALSPLPDANAWADIEVQVVTSHKQPRFHQVLAPSTWPEHGDLWVRIRMLDANLLEGNLEVRDVSQQITSLEILNQGDAWFALRLHCASVPTDAMELQLRWIDPNGRASTSMRLLPPGSHAIASLPLNTPPDVIHRRLLNGEVLVLASPDYLAWRNLPADLQIFSPQSNEEEQALFVLLDVSGSMEGAGLAEARVAIEQLQSSWTSGPLWVVPFGQDLMDGIRLDEPAGQQPFDDLRAFGPTNLSKALNHLMEQLAPDQPLLILSDGATGEPDLPWDRILEDRAPGKLFCLPTGPDADWEFLSGLGEVLTEGNLVSRLDQALSQLQSSENLPVRPTARASFPLPSFWKPSQEHPRWQVVPGAEALLSDRSENVYLAVRRIGPGLLVGLADLYQPEHQALCTPLAAHFQSPGHSGWIGDHFVVQNSPNPPRILQDGLALEIRMLDPQSPVLWQAMGASPLKSVQVQFENGGGWSASPVTTPEFGNPTKLWQDWQEKQRNVLTGLVFRPRLLWAGLLLLTAAFILHKLSTR